MAINMQVGAYLKLKNSTYLSKDFDLEEENDSKSANEESKNTEKDTPDTEPDDLAKYFMAANNQIGNYILNISLKNQFSFFDCTLLNVHSEITIPPPRA